MIKNERQYRITKAAARRFADSLRVGADAAPNVDPIIAQASIAALESQLAELEAQISEYEALKEGRVDVVEATSLDALAEMFIKARIVGGLSQKELSVRLGLKEQQVQRYEETNYAGASLTRLAAVASALNINVRHEAVLGRADDQLSRVLKRLESAGLPRDMAMRRFASLAGTTDSSAARSLSNLLTGIRQVFGWNFNQLFGEQPLELAQNAATTARFKVRSGRNSERVSAYATYAHYLALLLLRATENLPRLPLPDNAQDFYDAVCLTYSDMTFENALRYVWSLGVPVLPLDDEGAFDGAYWRVDGRHVIVLKQKSLSSARWLFDLLHDFRHATQHPALLENQIIESPPSSPERINAPDEIDASEFAGDVTLAGHGPELVAACEAATAGRLQRLKSELPGVAKTLGVDLASAANFMAFQLSRTGQNWWGTAANLQPPGEQPWLMARDILLEHIQLDELSGPDQTLLRDALTEREEIK